MRRTKLISFSLVMCLLFVAFTSASCAKVTPQTVAATTAHNGTIVVQAVDKLQQFVIEQEKAGNIPRNQARTVMEGVGRALTAAQKVPPILDKINQLPGGSAEVKPLIQQVQDALNLVTTEVGQALIPVQSEEMRKQIAALATEVNKTIGIVYGWILEVKK